MSSTSSELASPGSRVLLIGSARHVTGSLLPDLPPVTTTLVDLAQTLVDRCVIPAEQIATVTDPRNPIELADAVEHQAGQAGDVFLLYYAGHGVLDAGGALHLATQATVDLARGRTGHQALAFTEITEILRDRCPARRIVTVIDACHAGRASVPQVAELHTAFDRAGQGSCLLAAASRDEHALAPPGARRTTFTGALIDFLNDGDSAAGFELTVDAAVRALGRRLSSQGMPTPRWWAVDQIGDLVLTDNPAYWPPTAEAPTPPAGHELVEGGQPVCPYPGLRAFTQAESRFFHGRTDLMDALVNRVQKRAETDGGPLFVVGPSGSGKSSLIHAGLMPALARGQAAHGASARWPALTLTPGSDPVGALADALTGPLRTGPEELRDQITDHPMSLPDRLRQTLPPLGKKEESRLLLVVDQFEEFFGSEENATAQQAFVAAVTALASHGADSGPAAIVVAVMRADFVEHASTYPELADALGRDLLVVGAMNHSQIRAAIEQPARLGGIGFDDGLVDLILADLGTTQRHAYSPGALPLLGHALYETWRRRTGRILTVDAYRDAGSIGGALADTAESFYSEFTDAEQALCRRAFVRLVNPTSHTRRTLPRSSLFTPDSKTMQAVLSRLTEARLLTLDRSPRGEDTVTITHEALIDNWPRLQKWIDQDQQLEQITQEIEPDARRWHTTVALDRTSRRYLRWLFLQPAADLLYSDRLIASTEARLGDRTPTDPTVATFLTVSREAAKRRRTVRLGGLAGLVLLVVVSIVAASIATIQSHKATDQLKRSVARELVAQAETRRDSNPRLALKLNVAADRIQASSGTRNGIISTLVNGYRQPPIRTTGDALAFSPDGEILATAASALRKDRVTLWDIGTPSKPRQTGKPIRTSASALEFSHDGKILATVDDDGVQLWDVRKASAPRQVGKPIETSASDLAFSHDGSTLTTIAGGHVSWWHVRDRSKPRRAGESVRVTDNVDTHIFLAPGGNTLATVSTKTDGGGHGISSKVTLWDMQDRSAPRRMGEPIDVRDSASALAFSHDGKTLATAPGFGHGNVTLWDVGYRLTPRPTGRPIQTGASALAFSPDGKSLATAVDGRVSWWNITDQSKPRRTGRPIHTSREVNALAFSSDGKTLAIHSYHDSGNGQVTMWDVTDRSALHRTGKPIHTSRDVSIDSASALAFSPDGEILATAVDGRVSWWNITDRSRPRRIGKPIDISRNVNALAFSSDGKTLATGSSDDSGNSQVTMWDVTDRSAPHRTGNPINVTNNVYLLAVSADSQTVAVYSDTTDITPSITGTGQGRVTLWNVENPSAPHQVGQPIHLFAIGYSLAFSSDGKTLANGIHTPAEDSVALWDMSVITDLRDHGMDRACTLLGRGLSHDQWSMYIPDLPYEQTCSP